MSALMEGFDRMGENFDAIFMFITFMVKLHLSLIFNLSMHSENCSTKILMFINSLQPQHKIERTSCVILEGKYVRFE